jgi:hypothetical protein
LEQIEDIEMLGETNDNGGQIETQGDAIDELLGRIKGAADGGNGAGNNGGGGDKGGGGGNGGDGGDDMGPLGRLLLEALRRTSEQQSNFTGRMADALIKAIERERDARQGEAQQLAGTITTALRLSADWAERVADLTERVANLEARLTPAKAGAVAGDDEGGGP